MRRNRCLYCVNYIYHADSSHDGIVCVECEEQVKKLDEKTVNWLMKVIDARIEKELNLHTDRYNHESSNYGYY
jgi:hypothetical protein